MIAIILFLCVIGADRLTKWLALQILSTQSIPVIYGFKLTLAWNKGVSYSLFADAGTQGSLVLTSFIVTTITLFAGYVLWRGYKGYRVWIEAMILGGAVSNLIDRVNYGAVIDFIELYACSYSFPIFNVADMFIVLGVFGLLVHSWFEK